MADRFGDNAAAKASEEATHYVDARDGTVYNNNTELQMGSKSNNHILTITSTVGSFQLTQASRLTARAVATTQLHGTVVDWGCGGGALALLAATQPKVERVIGLDYEEQNINTCRRNARQNGLEAKTEFYRSDSFEPFEAKDLISSLKGQVDFVIANPPASTGDDGFSFRRRIMKEAIPFLKPNSQLLLQALSYYGPHRFFQAAKEASACLSYKGVIKSSPWMELGAGPGGYDFKNQIQQYCREEKRGGMRYFCGPRESSTDSSETTSLEKQLTALEAMELWEEKGKTPVCQWHVYALGFHPKK